MAYSSEQKDELRREIAETCAAHIRKSGLAAVSARALASAMGKTHGWLYYFYPDFDAIVLAANSLTLRMLDERLTEAAEAHRHEPVSDRFLALALAYMRFSQEEPRRWAALFEHQMPEGRELSPEHKAEHYMLFRHVEAPLSEIMPEADQDTLRATARTIYSAVHGVISLSLQGRLDRVPAPLLENQLRLITRAFAKGYAGEAASAAGKGAN